MMAALALAACSKSAPDPKAQHKKLAEVGVVTVASVSQPIVTELPGRTHARMIAEIRPQIGGIIQKRLFVEGAKVNAGEVLYQIDPAVYQAAYASAQAALQKAQANEKSTQVKAERYAELLKINAVSKQDYDDLDAALKQAQADVALARAALENARINLGYTHITAPISGRVETSVVTPGALVTANQDAALTTVQQLDPIYVDVTQSSSDLLRLRNELGQGHLKRVSADEARIKVVLEDGKPYPHEGRLKFSGVTVNPTSGAITLRAVVPNPEGVLMPGMYVRAQLEEAVNESAILVPQQGVTRNAKGDALVLLVNAQNKVEQRPVEVDRAIGNRWLVSAGLNSGDRVIVEGVQQVRVGDEVRTKPMTPEALAEADKAGGK